MQGRIRLSFYISSTIYLLTIIAFVLSNIDNFNSYIYPIDDAYIHLSAAKNLVNYGVWGVGKISSNFSSSPFYTLLLSVFTKIFGVNIYYPLIINSFFGVSIIYIVDVVLGKINMLVKIIFTLYILLVGNVFFQTLMGMEHVVHGFEFLLLLYLLLKDNNHKNFWPIIILFNLMIITRFESLFVLLSFTIVFVIYDKQNTFKILIASLILFLTSILVGKYYLNGGFLPNSLLIKGNFAKLDSLSSIITFIKTSILDRSIVFSPAKFGVLPIFIGIFFQNLFQKRDGIRKISFLWMLTAIMNSIFGSFGWFYRYELYLVITGLLINFLLFQDSFRSIVNQKSLQSYLSVLLLLYLMIPIAYLRGIKYGFSLYKDCTNAIYNQHIFLSDFVKKYFNTHSIGVNDIGAISFFSDSRIVDFSGLCNNEVLSILRKYGWSSYYDRIYSLMRENDVAFFLVYKGFLKEDKLKDYQVIGKFVFEKEEITGGNEVYIVSRREVADGLTRLILSDKKFAGRFLPVNADPM